jgi:hypothetical protein
MQTNQRYYIRDSETNELWCLDYKFLSGDVKVVDS